MLPGFDVEDCIGIRLSQSGNALLVERPGWSRDSIAGRERFVPGSSLDKPLWIPVSQITEDSEVAEPGDEGTLTVTEWYAGKQGWL